MAAMDDECWQLNIEELLALQSILQSSLVCFVDGIQRVIDDDTAEQLVMEGCRGRRVSCIANVHPDLPDGDLTVQVRGAPSTSCYISVGSCVLLMSWWLSCPGDGLDGL